MSLVHEQMGKALAALSHIPKQRSAGVSYEFRSIDQLFNLLHPVLAEHGLFLAVRVLDDWRVDQIPGTPDRQGNVRMQTQAVFRVCVDVYAADGSMVTLGPGLAQSHDYGDKAAYQAQQNAIKYVLLEAFCVPTAEPDMDGRDPDPINSGVEQARLATNRLKADILAAFNSHTETAKAFWEAAMDARGFDPDDPILSGELRAELLAEARGKT